MSTESEFIFQSSKLPGSSYQFFEDMKRKGKFCDITFEIGDHYISAHRIILAAGIPYFRDAVCTQNSSEPVEKEIEISDIDHYAFDALIEFAYSCKVRITVENVKGLLAASCVLQVDEVRNACCKFLEDRLNAEIALDIWHCAHSLSCSSLAETVDLYIRKHFDEVSRSETFLSLPFTYLKELTGRDDLQVSSEERVFEAIIHWVEKSPSERGVELPILLKNVRMTLLEHQYLWKYVAKDVLIRASMQCRNLVDEVMRYRLFPEEREGLGTSTEQPRRLLDEGARCNSSSWLMAEYDSLEPMMNAAGSNERAGICTITSETTCSVQLFDTEKNEWHPSERKSVTHDEGSLVAVGGKAYLFCEKFAQSYDPKTRDLKYFPGSNRRFTGAAVHSDGIYVCGGTEVLEETEVSNKVEMFSPEEENWFTNIPKMQFRRNLPAVVAIKGYIYVLGGVIGRLVLKLVERYEVKNKKWARGLPMQRRRYAAGSATLHGKIYVCGGMSTNRCLETAEVFSIRKKKWAFISPMNTRRCKFNLLAYRGKLYALGGEDSEGNVIRSMEIYDPQTDHWCFGPPLDSDNKISGAFTVP